MNPAEKLINLTDAYITTTTATLDHQDLAEEHKVATVLCFHFGVFSVVASFLNMDQEQLRIAIFQYFVAAKRNEQSEASHITNRMFELGQTDIGKDIMQHGAFGYDAWINGNENAGNVLKDLIDDRLEIDAFDPHKDEDNEEEEYGF